MNDEKEKKKTGPEDAATLFGIILSWRFRGLKGFEGVLLIQFAV